jgi:hypothetical protein
MKTAKSGAMPLAVHSPEPAQGSARVARTTLHAALYIALGAITLSPLLWVRVPPLVDYPSHLARMWILVHGADIPELARNYTVHWRRLPDLAMDLIVPVLSTMMTVEQAGRVFVALMMGALIGGTAALHRAIHGRVGIWPIWSVLFVYNAELFWGFPTLFATGVYLFQRLDRRSALANRSSDPSLLRCRDLALSVAPVCLRALRPFGPLV